MLYHIVNYHNIKRTMREVVVILILLMMYAIKFGDAGRANLILLKILLSTVYFFY